MKISDILSEDDFIFSLCTFIDEFKLDDDKQTLVAEEPMDDLLHTSRCILAGAAEKLSNDYGITPPAWVKKEIYYLKHPIYAFDTQNLEFREHLRKNTPIEFASRNIFYGENVLSRV